MKTSTLIVEDGGAIAMEIRQGLERIGYRVPMIVDNGDDAIPSHPADGSGYRHEFFFRRQRAAP